MYIIYFDEVKNRLGKQQYYWLGAIAIPHTIALSVEKQVNELSNEVFGSYLLSEETEFHGSEIVGPKKHFKQFDENRRIQIYKDILEIIDSFNEILKIYIRIDSEKYFSKELKINEMAFMFLVERANQLMVSKNSEGLLIGDYDHQVIDSSITQLSKYREEGTLFRPQDITNLIDTVHYAKSHHSRLIQLADIYVHSCQLKENQQTKKAGIEIKEFMKTLINWFPAKYREWPQ